MSRSAPARGYRENRTLVRMIHLLSGLLLVTRRVSEEYISDPSLTRFEVALLVTRRVSEE